MDEAISRQFDELKVCVIVPTYNNGATVTGVLEDVLAYTSNVIVVIDGSTDDTREQVAALADRVDIVEHKRNRGKGQALLTGFRRAAERGFVYAITIDSDGQHFASDLPLFLSACRDNTLVVGSRNLNEKNMPGGNTFANRFSNFWFAVQTWRRLPDTQTGYRLYPVDYASRARWITSRYEAELELLVVAAWHGIRLVSVPVKVYYPPAGERVSHFRPFADFARISVLNTVLCFLAVVYGWPMMLYHKITRRGK